MEGDESSDVVGKNRIVSMFKLRYDVLVDKRSVSSMN